MKGKYRIFQTIVSVAFLLLSLVGYKELIYIVVGKSITLLSVVVLITFIYMLMNAGYAFLHSNIHEKSSSMTSINQITKPSASAVILTSKKYNSIIQDKEGVKPLNNTFGQNFQMRNPTPSNTIIDKVKNDFFEKEIKEFEKEKAGEILKSANPDITDINTIDESNINETLLPEAETAIFNKIKSTKFF